MLVWGISRVRARAGQSCDWVEVYCITMFLDLDENVTPWIFALIFASKVRSRTCMSLLLSPGLVSFSLLFELPSILAAMDVLRYWNQELDSKTKIVVALLGISIGFYLFGLSIKALDWIYSSWKSRNFERSYPKLVVDLPEVG